jgi:CRP-like cAMP-binding protein
MFEALSLLKELTDTDIQWMLGTGQERQVAAGTVVIQEGSGSEALFILLHGLVQVTVASGGDTPLATLGPGELMGEISFLEGRAPTATITAVEPSLLLAVPFDRLAARLAEDPRFAARWYKAFALISARRLRDRVLSLTEQLRTKETRDHLDDAIDQLKKRLHEADDEAAKRGRLPEELANDIAAEFREFCAFLNRELGDGSKRDEHVREELGARVKIELRPYMLATQSGERTYSKPRGYAGDFLSIELIYQNVPQGTGWLGLLLDGCYLSLPAARAVRNRRSLLAEEISRTCQTAGGESVHVTTLACGPAAEVFDVLGSSPDGAPVRFTLLDIDPEALAFVKEKAMRLHCLDRMELIQGNLIYLALGRQRLDLPPQDLVYSIGLIDYFEDRLVGKLINYIYGLLKPGGRVILGNFHPANVNRALMDYVLNWKLIHRTEADMNRLFTQSRFGRPCTNLRFEGEGINLFAECVRGPAI